MYQNLYQSQLRICFFVLQAPYKLPKILRIKKSLRKIAELLEVRHTKGGYL
jgi:hypothetical protein